MFGTPPRRPMSLLASPANMAGSDSNMSESTTGTKPFPLLSLPMELRLAIYHHAVTPEDEPSYYLPQIDTLRPCALAQVNRQLRAEVLPVFYAGNEFHISLPWDDPLGEDNELWDGFHEKLQQLSRNDCLSYVKKLDVTYSEDVWEDTKNFILGFSMTSTHKGDNCWAKLRIGSDETDWTDAAAVVTAFTAAVDRNCRFYMERYAMGDRCPISRIIAVLLAFAKLCPQATTYLQLTWDYGD